jgi:hypothetical protein
MASPFDPLIDVIHSATTDSWKERNGQALAALIDGLRFVCPPQWSVPLNGRPPQWSCLSPSMVLAPSMVLSPSMCPKGRGWGAHWMGRTWSGFVGLVRRAATGSHPIDKGA